MSTLDSLLERHRWQPPFLLKIDTEGHEREVIKGATRMLEQTDVVIAEVSVSPRFEGSYTFAEFIALMDSRGFRLDDILDGQKTIRGPTRYIDGMFVRNDSARRSPTER